MRDGVPDVKYVLNLDPTPRQLNPNGRYHWARKARAAAEYKLACKVDATNVKNAFPPGTFPLRPPVKATITFVVRTNHRRDPLNLYAAFKSGEDGIVAAGLLVDDDFKHYQPELRWEKGLKEMVRVELEEVGT